MASRSQRTVVGVFQDRSRAQEAINELRQRGFDASQIGVVGPGSDLDNMVPEDARDETYASEGAMSGLAAGAGVGALWGLGILAGVVPAIGPAIAGGTLAAILSSTAAGAAAAGLTGALIGAGMSREEADYYNSEFESGRTVVTVTAGDRCDEAESVLRSFGGYDMSSQGSSDLSRSSAMGGETSHQPAVSSDLLRDDDIDASLAPPVMSGRGYDRSATNEHAAEGQVTAFEEQLHVEKQPVEKGSVNVRKEVHTEHKTVDVPVQREEIVVERRPAGAGDDVDAGRQEIHIPVREEQVKVDKEMVAKESVNVSKRVVQDTEHVDATLRKEEIKVDADPNIRVDDRRGRNQ